MSDKSKKIIIVEDEPSLVFTLQDTLENEGYEVFVAETGQQGVDMVKEHDPDLMVLDLMLPGMSGFEVCEKVRKMNYTFPILILTAKDQEIDKVTGLNIGADDYMTKPFSVKELLARIKARLRRSETYGKTKPINEVELDPIHIDLKNAIARHPENGEVELTTREVELIRYLVSHANEPVSRDALLENVWRYEYSTNTRTVDVHISKLRSKIEVHPDDPNYLVTLHGVGYMLKMS
ncbi:response regulator transcription factor [Balneolaceae bacterium YR4-1]|uniref:Response regulator transcription factor n=1 Tax=Halalkalibaculum roseum TaxID=2709311 RepID=A0A6M1SU07_9BACT|nr:response regulator transcription factor [Halalkalibaculum roseum]NGP75588.1 response regulator transcription factor [Halalkalibaculum roseum]